MAKAKNAKPRLKFLKIIEAKHVAIANTRLFINREEGFIGTSLKKEEFLRGVFRP